MSALKKIPKTEKATGKKGKEIKLTYKKRKQTTINPTKKVAKVKSRKTGLFLLILLVASL